MYDLIGKPFRYGSDGSGEDIDCIHLVYEVLSRLDIPTPSFQQQWYKDDWRTILKALRNWGYRVDRPSYDGDVVLLPQQNFAFGVTWQSGILYINDPLQAVSWNHFLAFPVVRAYRCACFPLNDN